MHQLVLGKSEFLAVGLLALSVAITLLGAVRLLRLDEDMPNYRRVVQWLRKSAGETTGQASPSESGLFGRLSGWLADRQMASLMRHARRVSTSRWSRICRWQVGMVSGWAVWPWILAMVPFLLWATWSKRGLDAGFVQLVLVLLPGVVILTALARRTRTMSHELCMPVERKTYLRQLGAAAALSHLQLWLGMSAATVLGWMFSAGEPPAYAEVAGVLAFAGLFQVWFFGVGAWWAASRHSRTVLVVIITLTLIVVHLFVPLVWIGLQEAGWRAFQLPIAALFAIFGVLLAADAYRRWLAADFD